VSLLDGVLTSSSLIPESTKPFTRTRTAETGKKPDTGAPITEPGTVTVMLQLVYLRPGQNGNYREDVDAFVLCHPGTLEPGDVIHHPDHGRFRVIEDRPKFYGTHQRLEVKAV
jgi:hypothetical protein